MGRGSALGAVTRRYPSSAGQESEFNLIYLGFRNDALDYYSTRTSDLEIGVGRSRTWMRVQLLCLSLYTLSRRVTRLSRGETDSWCFVGGIRLLASSHLVCLLRLPRHRPPCINHSSVCLSALEEQYEYGKGAGREKGEAQAMECHGKD